MKYLIKNSGKLYNQNYTLYKILVMVERPFRKMNTDFSMTTLIRAIKKYYKSCNLSRRQSFVVHPNQRINTNLDWTEILRSN